jgi:TonB family protein
MQGLGLGLDQKAIDAVKQWEYQLHRTVGDGSQDIREVDLEFSLDRPAPWKVASEAFWFVLPPGQPASQLVRPVLSGYLAPEAAACESAAAVRVGLLIGEDGKPREVQASDGLAGPFADAAVKAIGGWQFQPATADGKTVEARGEVELACRPYGATANSGEAQSPVYRVGNGVSAPALTFKSEPEYSQEARQARLEGSNTLYLQVSPAGTATNIHVVRMLGMGLDEKAMEAVKRWRFTPAMKDGHPVTVEATVQVNFKLLSSPSAQASSNSSELAQAGASRSVEDDVRKTDEAYRLAKLHQDTQALDGILADEFNETNQNGNSRNKAQTLELWRTFSISSLTTDTFQVRLAGDTAIVIGTQTENGTERMLFTRVYVKRPNAWQLLASMQFRNPNPGRP